MVAARVRERHGERGLTIVEVLIAMAVSVFGLAAVLSLHLTGSRATQYSRHATEAAMLGEGKLEQLLVTPAASLADGSEQVDGRGRADASAPFARSWTVADSGTTLLLTVTIVWDEDDGEHRISYRTRRLP